MADLLVRHVSDAVVKSLKNRANRHRRSLQRELIAILESAAENDGRETPARIAAIVRARLSRRGRRYSDGAASIHQDRNR